MHTGWRSICIDFFRPRQRTFIIVDPVVLQGVGLVRFGVFNMEQNGQEVS